MTGGLILYNTEDGRTQFQLRVIDGTVWLSQADLAELFQTSKQNISLHLKNIFGDGDLAESAVVKEYLTTEAKELDLLVSAFLDLATDRAQRRQQTTMSDWLSFADQYLKLAERAILTHAGSVSREEMLALIGQRYSAFDTVRRHGERDAAEMAFEQDVAAELRQIEQGLVEAKRRVPRKPKSDAP